MLRIRVLGELTIEADGVPLDPPAGRPARTLLGWLALHPGTHARSAVAARLWPDVLDASARRSLRTALSVLRASLGPAAAGAISATRERVGVAGEPGVWVDVRAFGALMQQRHFEEALELCAGELLPDLDADWVLALRDEHREQQSAALEALAAAADRAGDRQRALALVRRRALLDPFDEPAHRLLMLRLAAAGDRAGAVAAYERLAARLRAELGVAPAAETRRLVTAMRDGSAAPPAPGGSPAPPVVARRKPALPARLTAGRRPTPFVGRGAALDRLRTLWAEASAGEHRVVLVTGEPGVGKTRLAVELARELHAAGAVVLYGRAEEDSLIPYQPFVEALREALASTDAVLPPEAGELAALLPEVVSRVTGGAPPGAAAPGDRPLAGPTDRTGARLRLFEAVAGGLEAAAAQDPLLLVLDDLHWADRPTVRLLVYVAARLPPRGALLVVSYRDTDLVDAPPLVAGLADLAREARVDRLALDGLGTEAVTTLVTRLTGRVAHPSVVRALRERTAGNAFFLEEVLHGLGEREVEALAADRAQIPEGAVQAVARRIERLGTGAGAILTAGAVAGPEFDLDLVAEVAGLPRDAAIDVLDAAVRARVVQETAPGRYGFVHALARDALTRGLTAARTARLHDLIAGVLARRAGQDPDRYLRPLAHHALEAAAIGDFQRATALAEQAADSASAVHAHEDAVQFLRRALGVMAGRGGPPRRRAELLLALGRALQRAGAVDAARAAFDEAAELAARLPDDVLLAHAALGGAGAGAGVTILDVDRSRVERLESALARLESRHGELRARLLARLAIELAYDPDGGRRERLSREGVELARRTGDEGAQAAALGGRHVALWGPDHVEARVEVAREMLALARRAGDRELALQARNWLVLDALELGDGDAVRAELEAYAALASEARLPAYSWYVPVWRATLALLAGRVGDALDLGRRARSLGHQAGDANADVFWEELRHSRQLAEDRFGEDDGMLAYIEHRAAASPAGRSYRATLAWRCAALGRRDDAHGHLQAVASDGFAHVPRDMNWLPAMASATEAAALLGDAGAAAQLRRLLEPHRHLICVSGRGSGHYGSVAYLLARLAAAAGDWPAADVLYAEAAQRDDRAGARIWVVRDLRRHGEALLARGEADRANAVLEPAEREARALGLTGIEDAVRRLRREGAMQHAR